MKRKDSLFYFFLRTLNHKRLTNLMSLCETTQIQSSRFLVVCTCCTHRQQSSVTTSELVTCIICPGAAVVNKEMSKPTEIWAWGREETAAGAVASNASVFWIQCVRAQISLTKAFCSMTSQWYDEKDVFFFFSMWVVPLVFVFEPFRSLCAECVFLITTEQLIRINVFALIGVIDSSNSTQRKYHLLAFSVTAMCCCCCCISAKFRHMVVHFFAPVWTTSC